METPDTQASKRLRHGVADASGGLELRPWYQFPSAASRICRVSRASGGKDRHSKVLTAKGLRDRRVRLSVSTAIQFYDLQDRLGYDQPSKAVEWLIKAAAVAIADLPSLDGAFPDLPLLENHQENENKSTPIADEDETDDGFKYATNHRDDDNQMQQHDHLSKSACSSTSETSKGSVLSLSRSEIRVKARERARERTATAKREKDIDGDDTNTQIASDMNPQSQSSFIELLTGGNQNHSQNQAIRVLPATADYFGQNHGFPHQASFNMASEDHHDMMHHHHHHHHPQQQQQQQQQLSFLPDQLIPFARGTLQSNFPSMGASNLPFFINASWESQLQLYYDGYAHLDLKGKEKS